MKMDILMAKIILLERNQSLCLGTSITQTIISYAFLSMHFNGKKFLNTFL